MRSSFSNRSFPALSRIALAVIFSTIPLFSFSGGPLRPDPRYSQIARRLAYHLPREHLTHQPLNDIISCRTWTNYITSLDYNRVYFLQSDIEAFKTHELTLDDALKSGDVSFAYQVFAVFLERVRDRNTFTSEILKKGFDFNRDESFVWRRKDSIRAANKEEWDDLWRKKIKNEYLRRLVGRELAEEEKKKKEAGKKTPAPDTKEENKEEDPPEDPKTSPEEYILKPYQQYLMTLDDSDAAWVLERYLSAFARSYDPHSDYMSPSNVEDFEIEMKLSLVGIGALLRAEDGAAKIVRLIPGGPASRDKREKSLKPGDKIIAVGQGDDPPVDILHWPLNKTVRLIRGEKGTKVVLVVIAASDPTEATIKKVDIIRDEVKLEEQAAKLKMATSQGESPKERKLGIITLPAFYANMQARSTKDPEFRSAAHDVQNLLTEAVEKGAEGLVLDLRNNGGGSLPEAIRIAGHFITEGPVVQVKERFVRVVEDRDPALYYDGPLVILVNRVSASASEIVAGALKDYGRAILIGDSKTHGKGSVQTVAKLGLDEKLGKLKVTSWLYYRVSGGSTQLRGVTPDIIIPSAYDFMELGEDQLPNAIAWSTVPRANYEAVADLSTVIPGLKAQSEARREKSARFKAYATLLDRIDKANKAEALTLNLEKRRKQAKTEKEIADHQEKLANEAAGEDEQSDKLDVVLEESLKILCDFITLHDKTPVKESPKKSPGFWNTIKNWF